MLRATHLSVGVAAALAVLRPGDLSECLAVTGIAAVGSVISDIDADQSKVRREADLMLGIGAAVLAVVMIAQTRFHVDLTKYLSGNQTLSERSVAAGVFIILCVIGRMTPHRSFMHSLAAGAIFTMVTYTMFSKQAALAFFSRISDAYPAGPAKLQGNPAFLASPGAPLFQTLRLQWMGQPDFMPDRNSHGY